MPTVLVEGPYRFFWYSGDRTEPPHVHVERDDDTRSFGSIRFRSNGITDSQPANFARSKRSSRLIGKIG